MESVLLPSSQSLDDAKTALDAEKTAYGICAQSATKADNEIKEAKKARKTACAAIEGLIG